MASENKVFTFYAKVSIPVEEGLEFGDYAEYSQHVIEMIKSYVKARNCTKYFYATLTSDPRIIKVHFESIHCSFEEFRLSLAKMFDYYSCDIYPTFKDALKEGEAEVEVSYEEDGKDNLRE